MRRNALVDSSSAIILFKSDLFGRTMGFYRVVMARSVFLELTVADRPGAEAFKGIREEGLIHVADAHDMIRPVDEMERLGRGERDTILLYLAGAGEFIILDDGRGSAYCRRRRIPHINALLVPRILKRAGLITADQCGFHMKTVRRHGRYSRRVAEFALNCEDDALGAFG